MGQLRVDWARASERLNTRQTGKNELDARSHTLLGFNHLEQMLGRIRPGYIEGIARGKLGLGHDAHQLHHIFVAAAALGLHPRPVLELDEACGVEARVALIGPFQTRVVNRLVTTTYSSRRPSQPLDSSASS